MDGIFEEFEALVPEWEQLAWEWAVLRRSSEARARENAGARVDLRSRPGKSTKIVARYKQLSLDTVQRREVTRLASRGFGWKRIARKLDVSPGAVRWYLAQRQKSAA